MKFVPVENVRLAADDELSVVLPAEPLVVASPASSRILGVTPDPGLDTGPDTIIHPDQC